MFLIVNLWIEPRRIDRIASSVRLALDAVPVSTVTETVIEEPMVTRDLADSVPLDEYTVEAIKKVPLVENQFVAGVLVGAGVSIATSLILLKS